MTFVADIRARLLGAAPAPAAAPDPRPPAPPGPRGEDGDAALVAVRSPLAAPPEPRSHLVRDPQAVDPVAQEFWADAPENPFARERTLVERFFIWVGRSLGLLFTVAAIKVAWDAANRFQTHEGWILSGHIAYSALLSMFPFLIFVASVAAVTIGPSELQALIDLMFEVAPVEVANAIRPILEQALGVERRGVLTFAGLGALWAASNGVEAFRIGFDRAYQPPKLRGYVVSRAVGLVFVLIGTAASLIMGFAVVLAPLLMELTQQLLGWAPPYGLGILRYMIALAAFALFLYMMHAILPSGRPRARRLWPGITATIVLWTAAASAFSVYLARFPTYSVTYGSLAGVIVTLLFFYLSGAVILYGAEVNAAIHRRETAAAKAAAA